MILVKIDMFNFAFPLSSCETLAQPDPVTRRSPPTSGESSDGCSQEFKERERGSILSKLPPEIWGEIGKRLQSPLDVLRFRSVCRTWRSSLPPPSRFRLRVPPLPGDSKKHLNLQHFISELTYYVCAVNQMVVALEETNKGGNFFCFASVPLARRKETELLWPGSMELSGLSFLSNAYYLNCVYKHTGKGVCDIYRNLVAMKIVIISSSDAKGVNPNYTRVSDLTVVAHLKDERKLAVLRLPNSNWETHFCSSSFEDIINYRGRLYAVDRSGSGFVMDYTSLQMTKVAAALPDPPDAIHLQKKLHLAVASNSNSGVGHLYLVINCTSMRPNLYKLSSGDRRWIQVEFHDDHAFFLDPNCNFPLARDLLPRNGVRRPEFLCFPLPSHLSRKFKKLLNFFVRGDRRKGCDRGQVLIL